MSLLARLRTYLPRWVGGLLRHHKLRTNDDTDTATAKPAVECYACTQAGAPAFHSTSCDRAHPPEWAATAGSSLIPIHGSGLDLRIPAALCRHPSWLFGRVLDPRSPGVKRLNRALLLARGVSLAVDPLFFYALSVGRGGGGAVPCVYMDGELAAVVTVLRTVSDVAHVVHVWVQFRVAYVSRESLVVGCGKLVWDPRMVADHYFRSVKGFWFDLFVILPVPQTALVVFSEPMNWNSDEDNESDKKEKQLTW